MQGTRDNQPKLVLALSGGGVRGAAHAGVLRAFDAAGLSISGIAGTSSGALVALLYTLEKTDPNQPPLSAQAFIDMIAGSSLGELYRVMHANKAKTLRERIKILITKQRLFRTGLSNPGITTLDGLRKALAKLIGSRGFADLAIPLAFVATDLMLGEKVTLNKDPLIESVLASCAIPGVFQPIEIHGRSLVDGHVIDNVPVEAARSLLKGESGVVVAIDVGLHDAPVKTPKGAFDAVLRAAEVSRKHLYQASLKGADLVIAIGGEVPANVFELDRAEALYQAGFERGQKAAAKILELLEATNDTGSPTGWNASWFQSDPPAA